jgi:hypothetical protein
MNMSSHNKTQVSNIADYGNLGIIRTLHSMIPLLQAPPVNAHATLITLFMNAVEMIKFFDPEDDSQLLARAQDPITMRKVLQYLPVSTHPTALVRDSTTIYKILLARDTVESHDEPFNR